MLSTKLVLMTLFISMVGFAEDDNLGSFKLDISSSQIDSVLEALATFGSSPVCVHSEGNPEKELIAKLQAIRAERTEHLKMSNLTVFVNNYGKSTACLLIEIDPVPRAQ